MASVEVLPAAGEGIKAEGQQQQQQQPGLAPLHHQAMPHSEAEAGPASVPGSAGTSTTTTTISEGQAMPSSKRHKGMSDGAPGEDSGRPSRRAASAAQVAIAQTCAFEQQQGDMSPPQRAQQTQAMHVFGEAAGHDTAQQHLPQQPSAAAGGAAAAEPPAAAEGAAAAAANGSQLPKKRKRLAQPGGGTPMAEGAAPASGAGATPAAPGAQQQLHAPSQPVDLGPLLELARASLSQDDLRAKIVERYPASRGRSAVNVAFRDLFLGLCPGQIFHGRSSALPHMSHRLFELAGKPVGKAPAPYKPRGPRSPPSGPAAAAATPGNAAPASAPAPAAGAAAADLAAAAAAQQAHPAMGEGGPAGAAPADVGPAAAAAARAAATASGEIIPGGPGWMDPKEAMARVSAEYPAELIRVAALVRRSLGMHRGAVAHLRMMLKTLHLANQDVRFQTKAGKVLNKGKLSDSGGILCYCRSCNGREVSASEFEEHSGSKDRRPADGIFLQSCNRSLKDLLNLINSAEMAACTSMVDVHMEACYHCNLGGELLCCDGCNCAFHTECVNLGALPSGDWFCPLCVTAGITSKPVPLPLQPKQLGALKPIKASAKTRPGSSGKLSRKAGGGGDGHADSQGSAPPPPTYKRSLAAPGGGTGRVHMAAPTAPRAPRLGRPGARSNKNKRLFEGEEGALVNGQTLFYRTTQGETLLEGVAVVEPGGPSGIMCGCCNTLISASGFEAHAGRGQRRAPYDNIFTEDGITLKAMAALLPELDEEAPPTRRAGEYGLEELADDAREVISELDTLAGGCVLCHEVDFQRGGFGPRTIMLCDQCEREFHVGCLKKCGKCDLDAVPEGDWYCSEECERVRTLVTQAIHDQQMDIPGYPNHTWQVMRGKDGKSGTAWALRSAQEILQESFDPIMDLGSNTDLLPVMLYARRAGEWDYSNCLTLLLRHKGKPVVAAIVRVFGPQMAELPLIATRSSARRQGHARILVDCFQDMLKKAGVHTLVLPAAHETVETWKSGFQFVDMPEDQVQLAKNQLRILIFPGTEVLFKQFAEVPAPQGHHILVPAPDKPSPEEASDFVEVAAITSNMVAVIAAYFGEPILPDTLGMTGPEVAEVQLHREPPQQQQQQQQPVRPAAPAAAPQGFAQQPGAQQHYAQPHHAQQQQQQQQAPGPGPMDEYEAMIAQAMAAADRQVAAGQAQQAGGWGAPTPMDVDGSAEQQQQQQPATSSSDVSISDADDDDDDGVMGGLGGASS